MHNTLSKLENELRLVCSLNYNYKLIEWKSSGDIKFGTRIRGGNCMPLLLFIPNIFLQYQYPRIHSILIYLK